MKEARQGFDAVKSQGESCPEASGSSSVHSCSTGSGANLVSTRPKRSMGIMLKLILIFMAIKVVPLILLCWLSWHVVASLGSWIETHSQGIIGESRTLVQDVGRKATQDSIRALDDKSREAIERLTTDTARQVAEFLKQRDQQILLAAQIPPDEAHYRRFLEPLKRTVLDHGAYVLTREGWEPERPSAPPSESVMTEVEDNRKDWSYRPSDRLGTPVQTPLYAEMTFIDLQGNETIKVTTVPWMTQELRHVLSKENTFCKAEDYGSRLAALKPGEVEVSEVVGAYVPSRIIGPYTPARAEAAGVPFEPELAAYAGKENPVGRRFQGIVRWVTPVMEGGAVIGYVSLALNHEHLNELTRTIVPTDARYTDINDASSGNYAFIWDYKGRSICHPRHHSIWGYDPKTGEPAIPWMDSEVYERYKASGLKLSDFLEQASSFESPSLKRKPATELTRAGMVGLDGRFLNFAPQCKGWHELTSRGGSGSFLIFWSGLWKLTTAASIPYHTGRYAGSPRGFGYVTIGANVDEFHAPAMETAKHLDSIIGTYLATAEQKNQETKTQVAASLSHAAKSLGLSTLVMVVVVILIAVWMAAVLTRRITAMIAGIQIFKRGDMDHRLSVISNDEMGDLARSFNEMADELQSSIRNLVESQLREKTREKDALIAYNAGLFESASSYFHNIGNAVAGIEGRLTSIRRALESTAQYPEAFCLIREAHAKALHKEGTTDQTESLLSRLEDILMRRMLPRVKQDVEAIAKSQQHMIQTIKFQQDTFNQSKHKGLRFIQSVNVTELIQGMVEDFQPTLQKYAVTVQLDLEPEVLVRNQKNPLLHGLTNLLNNAMDAVNASPSVTKEIRLTLRRLNGDVKRARIQVQDNGVGIRDEDRPFLFQSGFTTKPEGHGLGLHSFMNFLNENNGSIEVRSAGPNQGTEFTVEVGDE